LEVEIYPTETLMAHDGDRACMYEDDDCMGKKDGLCAGAGQLSINMCACTC